MEQYAHLQACQMQNRNYRAKDKFLRKCSWPNNRWGSLDLKTEPVNHVYIHLGQLRAKQFFFFKGLCWETISLPPLANTSKSYHLTILIHKTCKLSIWLFLNNCSRWVSMSRHSAPIHSQFPTCPVRTITPLSSAMASSKYSTPAFQYVHR